ncbi:OPT/YSL family transporter [Candidatus Uhrbacteria bacterium]|nr:OPT/YSL family transporter [Candidatus Uhrbacteria bacterium]
MKDLNWRLLLIGMVGCAVSAAAIPYVTLKLGQSVDLTLGAMFVATYVLGRRATGNRLAIQLNILQSMITAVSSIAFMVVILSAFYYIQTVFERDIGFNPSMFQMFVWLTVSASLGVFLGILPRHTILKDRSLPWPSAKATLSVAKTLSDPKATGQTKHRRDFLVVSTAVSGFLTFLKDGLGVITPMVGNSALKMSFSLEFMAIGIGMLVPLSVGLSGLLGTWIIGTFGETAAQMSALSGTPEAYWGQCQTTLGGLADLAGPEKTAAMSFLKAHCGEAAKYAADPMTHFRYMVQWMMWPATAMMVSAALTGISIPVIRSLLRRKNTATKTTETGGENGSLADERVPLWWTAIGIAVSVTLLVWLTSTMFRMPLAEVILAVTIQPILIIAGLRVLGITGTGPVSLMANATQFLFGLIWPAQIRSNLVAAFTSASPQATSENIVPSFWVAQRLGGKFRTLVLCQLIVIPIGALLTPLVFKLLQHTYGIGLDPGQLAAPTGLKIASLAIVMERGLSALPPGALTASAAAIAVGVLFEILLAVRRRDADGKETGRFGCIPIPSALGFALILPPSLTIGIAVGSVIAAVWRKFCPPQPDEGGKYDLYAAPIASGMIAGEAIIGSILLPAIAILTGLIT